MKFKTRFDSHERYFCNSGNPYHNTYAVQINESGQKDLVVTGSIFIPDEINSHAESVDVHNILARFANGETEVLSRRVGEYFDASQFPSNLADMYRTVANGEEYFNKLPVDVRAKFDHSFYKFISTIGTPEFESLFSVPKSDDVVSSDGGDTVES